MLILSFDVGIVNLAYCIYDTSKLEILHWEVVNLENTKDYSKLYVSLINNLDERKHLLDNIHTVLIEKQPSFNPKMRIIAGCLQTYFYIRGVVDLPINKIKNIKFYSPKHKLKCYDGDVPLEDLVTCKTKYSRTKKMGIIVCEQKIRNQSINIKSIFKNTKKKDDLSDCFLQVLTYCYQNKLTENTNISIPNNEPFVSVLKRITKAGIKKALISHLSIYDTGKKLSVVELLNNNIISIVNNIDNVTKVEITEKFNISFPIEEYTLIKTLFSELGINKYLKCIYLIK